MKKSAIKSAPGRPFQKGGDPRQGRGPKPGAPNAGRPPSEITELCRRLIRNHKLLETVILPIAQHADKATDRLAATRLLLEYGEGKPLLRSELTGRDGEALAIGLRIFDDDDLTG